MKMAHRISSSATGPAWELVFGAIMTALGVALWCYGKLAWPDNVDQSLGVAALLIGVFISVYAGHEILRGRRRR
ncbi:hypothetical protein AWB80_07656 [Caballeronia pedi]|uniref:Uncharacterized protein n=1 Tax=Caballeronia pedi TaxID=1777141 RepID=A0A158DXR9_9BURK|nr:hypothetical protein [Caballeronia pedi]SAK99425.1 hypothetical protein AWB80_07656 [Caballeronia pedi]